MLLLSCANLSRGFDGDPLFNEIGFELQAGERVGLVGPNGVGKTTLLRLLVGQDRPDEGEVRLHAGARIGLLTQTATWTPGRSLFEEAQSALDEFLLAQEELVRTAEALAAEKDEARHKALSAKYDRLNELLRHNDAYQVDHRVEEVLQGLGFPRDCFSRTVETFSGGQQSRLMLAKMLLAAPDVMLLDEPSNHLDIQTTGWLENYLIKQPQAMLVVSHDRYFLDRVVTKIFELHKKRITSYPGNYKAYARLRQERYEQQLKTYEAQKEYIQKQEEYIRRVHYGQLHKQAASRQKQIDKIERIERPSMVDTPLMRFGEVKRTGDVVVQVQDLAKAYDRPLFSGLTFALPRGKRLAIMGPNGSGKTTLLRILLGQETPDEGTVQIGHLVDFGYYDQHLRSLDERLPVIQAVWPEGDATATEQKMRDLLARFGLMGDIVNQPVHELSGGERSRAAFVKLVARGFNVLVLDEPTNHLDLWARDALEQALLLFDGTVLVVSHDRYFLNHVADLMIVFDESKRCQLIHGNYDTYEMMRAQQKADDEKPASSKQAASAQIKTVVKRKRRFAYRKAHDIESEIAQRETSLRELEIQLADPDIYRDANRVKNVMKDFEDTKVTLSQLYEHWEEAVELNG